MIAHAGVVLPRLLADRVELSGALSAAVARRGFCPGHDRGRVLTDLACALAAGARTLTDVEAIAAQLALIDRSGRGPSDTTIWRSLGEFADRLGADGLPGPRLAQAVAQARAVAWERIVARHGGLPPVAVAGTPLQRTITAADGSVSTSVVTVIRLDATLIAAASAKEQAAGTYKGGWGSIR